MKFKPAKPHTYFKMYKQESNLKQNGFCFFCYEPMKIVTGDHLKPKSKGGNETVDNIKAVCYDCNQAKGTLSESSFRKMIKNPFGVENNFKYLLIWSRRKLWLKYHRSTKRLGNLFGLDIAQPNN